MLTNVNINVASKSHKLQNLAFCCPKCEHQGYRSSETSVYTGVPSLQSLISLNSLLGFLSNF